VRRDHLEYEVGADRKSYRIRSAGSDKKFQPAQIRARGKSSRTEDDLIYENGELLAWWEELERGPSP
jgi:hypothetical protein